MKYQVRDGGEVWVTCKKASTNGCRPGWLHYELADGTVGLAFNKPGKLPTWREKLQKGAERETTEEQ